MAEKASRTWEKDIVSRAESLGSRHGGSKPAVALSEIASLRQIRDVLFKPLLVGGVLVLRDHGFALYVKSRRSEASSFLDDFWGNGGRNLHPRTRFTIAHELVHTFLYDVNTSPPQPKLKASSDSVFRKLERACNKGAARLLLPDIRMNRYMAMESIFEPEILHQFTKESAVSPEVFILRCRTVAWGSHHGGFGIVETGSDGPTVTYSATDPLARGLLTCLNGDESLPPSTTAGLMSRSSGSSDEKVPSSTGEQVPFTSRWTRISSSPQRWLVTFQMNETA